MDFSWEISYSLVIVTLLLTLAVFYIIRVLKGEITAAGKTGALQDTNTCASPNCVRCTQKALKDGKFFHQKLSDFLGDKKCNTACLHRIKKAIVGGSSDVLHATRQKPTTFFVPGLCSMPWYETNEMNCRGSLAILDDIGSQRLIKQEFLQVFQHLNEGWFKNSTPEGDWFIFPLYNQGVRIEENCKKCPQTVTIIDDIKLLIRKCAFGNALFSVLLPGTHITPHYGPTNCRVRCHVPLIVPQGCCGIAVDGDERHWEVGRLLLFDDSFYHEAWHRGCANIGPRVVLMLDLWHPDLTDEEKDAVIYLFPHSS